MRDKELSDVVKIRDEKLFRIKVLNDEKRRGLLLVANTLSRKSLKGFLNFVYKEVNSSAEAGIVKRRHTDNASKVDVGRVNEASTQCFHPAIANHRFDGRVAAGPSGKKRQGARARCREYRRGRSLGWGCVVHA